MGSASADVFNPSADDNQICKIDGPNVIKVGKTYIYAARIQDGDQDDDYDVTLDDQSGESDITSFLDGTAIDNHVVLAVGVDALNDLATVQAEWIDENTVDWLLAQFDYKFDGTVCGTTVLQSLVQGVDLHDICDVNGDGDCADSGESVSNAVLVAVAAAVEAAVNNGLTDDCDFLADEAEDAAILAGAAEAIADNIWDWIEAACEGNNSRPFLDNLVIVDVTCYEAGEFELTFANAGDDTEDVLTIDVVCGGDVETAEIFGRPTSVEINPSLGNVAHSLVWVVLKDDQGEASAAGTPVVWMTDRCSIEASTVDTEAELLAANTGPTGPFNNFSNLSPATGIAVENSVFATTAPDSASRQQEEALSFVVTGPASTDFAKQTISAVILHCDPIHAPGVTPGPAVVTAIVNRGSLDNSQVADNDDLVLKQTITVVGPPAANGVTVTAAPSTLACGEKATITVNVKDSIGQPVSDHTWVEAVTNAGGVLAGTGAVAGRAGLVSPVSSTVADTFGGTATLYLLTSTAHVGAYEVVVTTGGGGGVTGQLVNGGTTTNLLGGLFTTAPISVQVTVTCSVPTVAAPAAAPATSGPATGQAIRPPSTGDAGLVSSNGSSMTLIAIAGAVALIATGFALKVVRAED